MKLSVHSGKAPLWAAQVACGMMILGNLTALAFQSLTDDDSGSVILTCIRS